MGKGPYWTLARPYHLTSLEIPRTIRHIMLDKVFQVECTKLEC
jgi:predicted homoserine dehydrogenase-like protein